jgi:acetyltransferase-like isoleucine patch superfamily enzyme
MNIAAGAKVGVRCTIAPTAIIHANVELGDDTIVEDFVILGNPARGDAAGKPLVIGTGGHIRSHTIMYEGSCFGENLRVGHSSLLREGITAGENLQVGSLNVLEGDATFGDWVRLHSNVHISKGSEIGDLVWIFPYVVTTNDPLPPSGLCVGVTIGAGAVVCTSSVVLPGITLGIGAFIGAMSRVSTDVPAGGLYVGNPGLLLGPVTKLRHKPTGKQHPWYGHHADAYPSAAQQRILEISRIVDAACANFSQPKPNSVHTRS